MAKDVATKDAGTVALRPYERFVQYMQERAEIQNNDERSFNVSAQLMDKILSAETMEDIWEADEGGMVAGRDLIDVEQVVRGYVVMKTTRDDFDNPLGVYVVVDAVRLEDGTEFVWNTGAAGIVAKLRAFEAMDGFPLECVIRGIRTSSGYDVLKLRPVPKRSVPGTTA
jgi:hypothetical protein